VLPSDWSATSECSKISIPSEFSNTTHRGQRSVSKIHHGQVRGRSSQREQIRSNSQSSTTALRQKQPLAKLTLCNWSPIDQARSAELVSRMKLVVLTVDYEKAAYAHTCVAKD
jgi:hypothetical protein